MNLKIMTFNINNGSNNADWINELTEIINRENLDIVLLQEIKPEWINNFFNENFPGWKTYFSQDKCNTILIKNNYSAEQINFNKLKNAVFVYENQNNLLLGNIHATYHDDNVKWRELRIVKDFLESNQSKSVIVGGDFNICYEAMKTVFDDFRIDGEDGSWFTTVTKDNKGFSLSSDYDHFLYSKVDNKFKGSISRLLKDGEKKLNVGNRTFTTSKEYSEEISDHLPLTMSINIGD